MKLVKFFIAFAMILTNVFSSVGVNSVKAVSANEYELYPKPHTIEYKAEHTTLTNEINVVYEEKIDQDTKNRLKEVFDQKNITIVEGTKVEANKTNVLVGIKDSTGYVDQYVTQHNLVKDASLFTKTDAALLDVSGNVITILGKDSDAAFYALTSLYHVVNQMETMQMRNFHVEDYADIVSRGFIEGYYGNPWSTQDRINLMKWSGYYKLNSYFYAPKDDPKHNAKWRELYTDQEIKDKIEPLAKAGNESKCRFVYALHPYMYNAIATDTNSEQYKKDLKVMQDKFSQVIQAGVRQIAILADDANNKGGNHYVQMLKDMSAWLKEQKVTYPDLKLTLPFCTVEYMSNGYDYYKNFPENVQIVMTGGKVWGEVSTDFTNKFTNKVNRGPYMWVNWPCTDNSKQHLIMGGFKDFLHTGVDHNKVQGIVLNPMQQSEPSKVAIFGNACYSWNIWDSDEEADQAWQECFDYVDHNSAHATPAALALKELSKHMMNQNMDSRVRVLEESVVLKEKLNPIKEKLKSGTLTKADKPAIDELISEFVVLQEAAKTYRAQAGNANTREQIVYWLNCWDDTTEAAIQFLLALNASLNNDISLLVEYTLNGDNAFEKSKTYEYWYVDHMEHAEVGVQHIVPFIREMSHYCSSKMKEQLDPDYLGVEYITNRNDQPAEGSVENILDGKDSTGAVYKTPNAIKKDDYVGIMYSKEIMIKDLRFLQGAGKNHFDRSKLQYTKDGKTWQDFVFVNKENAFTAVENQDLEVVISPEHMPKDFMAKGVRLIATANNAKDAWLDVKEITVNNSVPTNTPLAYNLIKTDRWVISSGTQAQLHDGNDTTAVHIDPDGSANTTGDDFMVGDFIGYDLGAIRTLDSTHIVIGSTSKPADKIVEYAIETSVDNKKWDLVQNYKGKTSGVDTLNIDLNGVKARYIRIRVTKQQPSWGYFAEFSVKEKNTSNNVLAGSKGNVTTSTKDGEIVVNSTKVTLNKNEYVGMKLDRIREVVVTCPNAENMAIECSLNGVEWTAYKPNMAAAYVRARSTVANHEFDTKGFKLNYEIGNKKVESNMGNNETSEDVRTNAQALSAIFDGNLSTSGKVCDIQNKDKYVTFDYGQEIDLHSFRYYLKETSVDHIRHGEILASADNKTWTSILTIGNGQFDQDNNQPVKNHSAYTHDSSNPGYMYVEAKDLNLKARYFKIKPLTTYDKRWIQISELQLNGGEYISSDLTKDIIANATEVNGKLPSFALDRDFTTSYKPSDKNSSFTYRVRELKDDMNMIRFVTRGEISNASVSVRYVGETQFKTIGTLSKQVSELFVDKTIAEVKVTYGEVTPDILEIILAKGVPCDHAQTKEEVIKPATCTEKGKKAIVCTKCGQTMNTVDIEMTPHTYGEWEIVVKPTVEQEGRKERKCTVCKHVDSQVIDKLTPEQGGQSSQQATVDELKAAIQNAETKLASGTFTSESVKAVNDAIEHAKHVLGSSIATPTDRYGAIVNLKAALSGLKEDTTTQDTDKPSTDGDKPNTDSNKPNEESEKPNGQDSTIKPVEPKPESQQQKPQDNKDETGTGDSTNMMASVVAMSIAAIALIVVRKRKMNS